MGRQRLKHTSLYKERAGIGGKLTLRIDIRKNADADWITGLLLLAVKDIGKGYLPVGGQTSIGRGIFRTDREKLPEGYALLDGNIIDECTEDKYLDKILSGIGRASVC
ncbi:MAG: hypothetical protein LUF35_07275 [Lachnospiraceae bacterium]|nr:hypothetical protein [Lachnospiraceae bacterium]